jgi:hypothetical protein
MPCEQSHQQPDACAGIAEIEGLIRLGETADTDALNAPKSLIILYYFNAEAAKCVSRRHDVFAFQQTFYSGFADRHGGEHQGPMG